MNGGKKVILHITFDGVLFDQVYPRFEEMDRYENIYLLLCSKSNPEIKYIKHTEKLTCVYSIEEWGKVINDPKIDIIYMHGLWILQAIDYIRPNVIVMWWCYGKELYENIYGCPSLLGLKIYKPKTFHYILSSGGIRYRLSNILSYNHPKLYNILREFYNFILRRHDETKDKLREMLSRIDYVSTPLETELEELKKKHSYIKAKPFRLRSGIVREPMAIHEKAGDILLEHSANISDNHLDIIAAIKSKKLNLRERNIYVPLSYGEERIAERVKDEAKFEGANVHCLMEALPFEKYKKMMEGCTHAIFGMIRQSGLGNIYLCLRKGIKIFFFKDSILYKQFKADGYCVYSIEDDLNDVSVIEPLTREQAINNYNLFYSIFGNTRTYQQQFDNILKNR